MTTIDHDTGDEDRRPIIHEYANGTPDVLDVMCLIDCLTVRTPTWKVTDRASDLLDKLLREFGLLK